MVSSQDHIFKVKQQICLYAFLVCGVDVHAVPVKRETLPLLAEDGSLQGAGINAANQTVCVCVGGWSELALLSVWAKPLFFFLQTSI